MVGDRCVPSRRRKAGRVGTVSRECRWQHFLGVDQRSLPPGPPGASPPLGSKT